MHEDDPDQFEEPVATLTLRADEDNAISRSAVRLVDRERAIDLRVDREVTIGSAPGVDVRIEDPTVSRIHARVEPRDDGVWITDVGSTNGTWVDGVRVGSALLAPNARLRLGAAALAVVPETETVVQLWPHDSFGPILGRSTAMRELFHRLSRIAASDATVLVQGETGTGKDLVARAIHDASSRAGGPFIVFDCGAITETLFESELFGHAKGAFTGADRARDGAVQAAEGGTLFLDEVAELPPSVQPKLLRLLETRTVRRVGENRHQAVDVRLVAATHQDLARMVSEGAFREDLYFRLAVLPVRVPALRERRDDIPLLAEHFLAGRDADPALHAELQNRPWLGNVRELRSFIERAVALGTEEALRAPGLGAAIRADRLPAVPIDVPFKELREQWNDHLEREYLRGWLERTGGDVRTAAEAMGLDRTYLYRLMKKHDIGR